MTTTYRPHPVLWRALCLFNTMRTVGVPAEFIHIATDEGKVVLAAFTGAYGQGFICACGDMPADWTCDTLADAWDEAARWWAETDTLPDPVEASTALWILVQAAKVRWPSSEVN